MNPLFRNFARSIQDEARREFQRSATGQLVREIERLNRSGIGDSARVTRMTRELVAMAKRGGFQQAERNLRGTALGQFVGDIERYAKGGIKAALLETLFGALGPLGQLFGAMLRPGGRRVPGLRRGGTSIDQEINAAHALLQAFRPDLLAQKKPIPSGGLRFDTPADAKAAQALLESLGFTVTPPSQKRGQTVEFEPEESPHQPTPKPPPTRSTDPLHTGKMIRVVSSNVHSIGFLLDEQNPVASVLKVRFLQGPDSGKGRSGGKKVAGPLYYYYGVRPELFKAFQTAASKGKWVWDNLRVRGTVSGHQYVYALQGISGGYVPRRALHVGKHEVFAERQVHVFAPKTGRHQGVARSQLGTRVVGEYRPQKGAPAAINQPTTFSRIKGRQRVVERDETGRRVRFVFGHH